MKINRTKKFIKHYEKINYKVQIKFLSKLEIFKQNPFEESLRNHILKWKYDGLRSIDITWDYRAIFKEFPDGTYEFVDFTDIWTHSQLYKM